MKRKVIALTGFIGSGKSAVAHILRQWDYKTVDCDQIAREISDQSDVVARVGELLGEGYITDGKLNRPLIRERVFSDSELLARYQALFFDGVKKRILQLAANAQSTLFVEIAVVNAFDFSWDEVWRVDSDDANLFRRVSVRDGVTAENVAAIIGKQTPPITPTRVIVNNGTLADLEAAVKRALKDSNLLEE